jgi:hypothetical protein
MVPVPPKINTLDAVAKDILGLVFRKAFGRRLLLLVKLRFWIWMNQCFLKKIGSRGIGRNEPGSIWFGAEITFDFTCRKQGRVTTDIA